MVMRPRLFRPEPRFLLSLSCGTGPPVCRSGLTTLTSARRPGEVGLTLTSAMSLRLLREVDFRTGLEAHVRLLPVAAAAGIRAEALRLAADVHNLHAGNLDLLLFPEKLDGGFHIVLGRVRTNAEDDLIVLVRDQGRLFRNHGREQHRHQPSLVDAERRPRGGLCRGGLCRGGLLGRVHAPSLNTQYTSTASRVGRSAFARCLSVRALTTRAALMPASPRIATARLWSARRCESAPGSP